MKTDRLTVQMVVAFIGVACLLSIAGLILLSFTGHQAPEPLTTLAGAAIGALGSLLARTSTESGVPGEQSPEIVPLLRASEAGAQPCAIQDPHLTDTELGATRNSPTTKVDSVSVIPEEGD